MIFDAFGRLALGQVEQNFALDTTFIAGRSATGSAGSIKAVVSVRTIGGSGTGSGRAFVLAGQISLHGVSATGNAGVILTPDLDVLAGVSGTGSAGTFSFEIDAQGIHGAQGIASAGNIVAMSSSKLLGGVSAVGGAGGILTFEIDATGIFGVSGAGNAGMITAMISGGSGGKKPKMGLEPVVKRPPIAPTPVKLPTYVVPNFKPKAQPPLPELTRTPFERSPGIAPLDLMGMRQQIQSAQDEADIKAVLAFLDDLD